MKRTFAKTVTCAAALAVWAASAHWAMAKEMRVSIPVDGQSVVGTLEIPDDATAPAPVVLMLHGFTGTRDELPVKDTEDGVFTRTARELSKNGYASLRIDFAAPARAKASGKTRPSAARSRMPSPPSTG